MSTTDVAIRIQNQQSRKTTLLFRAQKQLAKELEKSADSRRSAPRGRSSLFSQTLVKTFSGNPCREKVNQKNLPPKECKLEDIEVQQLAATVVPNCSGSNILYRMDAKRRSRHEQALKDFYTELTNLGRELEKETISLSLDLQERIIASRKGIHLELQRLTGCLDTLKEKEILQIWESNDGAYNQHQLWIQNFKIKLWNQEDFRIVKSVQFLRQVYRELLRIGYESPLRVYNRLFQEAVTIDKATLSNRHRISSLCCHLVLIDVEAQKLQYLQWKIKKQNWIKNTRASANRQYKTILESLAIGSGGHISKEVIRKFRVEEHFLCLKRMKLLTTVRDIKPPCTQDNVELWLNTLDPSMKTHEGLVTDLKAYLTTNKDAILKQCHEETEKIKKSLVDREVCCRETADKLLEHSLPALAEDYLMDISMNIERVSRQAEYQKDSIDGLQDEVVAKLQMAVNIWETHQSALVALKESVQFKVDNILNDLDQTCQEMERGIAAELDIMREENSKSGLTSRFSSVTSSLDEMKKVYIRSHKSQMKIVRSYPKQVVKELNRYRQELEKFFGPVAGYLLDSSSDAKPKGKQGSSFQPISSKSSKTSVCAMEDYPIVRTNVFGSTLSTESAERRSKAFKLAPQPLSWHSVSLDNYDLPRHPGGTLSTPDIFCNKDKQPTRVPTARSEPQIGKIQKHEPWLGFETRMQQLLRIICINFAAHWEHWMREATEKARCEADAKTLELSNELELRLRLHAPRQRQIEESVMRLRAAELVYHSDRVKRHMEGVSEELNALQMSLQMLKDQQATFLQKLDEKIQETENVCATLGFSALIEEHVEKMKLIIETHIENHKDALKKFRNDVNEVLIYLRHSNGSFHKSFKNFQNNGNFSDEEASQLGEQLNKVYPMITSTEYTILTAVQQLENECVQGGLMLHKRIDGRFGYAAIDADFVEKLQRWFTNTQVKITAEVKIVNLEDAEVKKNADKLNRRLKDISKLEEALSFADILDLLSQYRKVSDGLVFRGLRLGILKPSFTSRYDDLVKDHEVVKIGDGMLGLISPVPSPAPSDKPSEKPSDRLSKAKSDIRAKQSVAALGRRTGPDSLGGDQNELSAHGAFRAHLKSLLNTVQTELLMHTEQFYRQKGDRAITCPEFLAETFDQCVKDVVGRLKGYCDQSETYFQQSLCDYLEQLQSLEALLLKVCNTVFPAFLQHCETILDVKLGTCQQEMKDLQATWLVNQAKFVDRLRPRLGHPKAVTALQVMKREEELAYEKMKQSCRQLHQDQQEMVSKAGQSFVHHLANFTEIFLKEVDSILSVKDLREETGSMTDVCLPETISGRLRRLLQGVGSMVASSTSMTDSPTPVNGLPYFDWEEEGEMPYRSTPNFVISKKSPNHTCAIAARDAVYTSYKDKFFETLEYLKVEKEKKLDQLEKWHAEWVASTKTLADSYSLFYQTT